MKYKSYEDIKPNNVSTGNMLYYCSCRILNKMEHRIRRRNNGYLPCRDRILLRRLHRKITQLAKVYKNKSVLA